MIFCDDFESPSEPDDLDARYFDHSVAVDYGPGKRFETSFQVVDGVGLDGSWGVQATFIVGEENAGDLKYNFGINPLGSQARPDEDFQEIYWRFYFKSAPNISHNPNKLTRATIFHDAGPWRRAIGAPVWNATPDIDYGLMVDPYTWLETPGGSTILNSQTESERYLGADKGENLIFHADNDDTWYCIETHLELNTSGNADGVLEYWIDGVKDAEKTGLDFLGTWTDYGINSIWFENFWNSGADDAFVRYWDNIVISTERIGCAPTAPTPTPTASPTNPPPTATPTADPSEPTGVLGYNWRIFQ
jgi:hypothetical protein